MEEQYDYYNRIISEKDICRKQQFLWLQRPHKARLIFLSLGGDLWWWHMIRETMALIATITISITALDLELFQVNSVDPH